MRLTENFWKTDEISVEPNFNCENQTKTITNKNWKNYRKVFGEFSVSYRQTNCESYLNEYSTIVDSAKGGPTQFWEIFTMIPCAPKYLKH